MSKSKGWTTVQKPKRVKKKPVYVPKVDQERMQLLEKYLMTIFFRSKEALTVKALTKGVNTMRLKDTSFDDADGEDPENPRPDEYRWEDVEDALGGTNGYEILHQYSECLPSVRGSSTWRLRREVIN